MKQETNPFESFSSFSRVSNEKIRRFTLSRFFVMVVRECWPFAVVVLAAWLLADCLFELRFGTTREADLTMVKGQPEEIVWHLAEKNIEFRIGPYRVKYVEGAPKYQEVLSAILNEKQLRVWVSTKQETRIPNRYWVPLYKLSLGAKTILTYNDTVAQKGRYFPYDIICSCVLFGFGLWKSIIGILKGCQLVIATCIRRIEARRGFSKPTGTPKLRIPSFREILLLSAAPLGIGVGMFLFEMEFGFLGGTITPEGELIMAEGVPDRIYIVYRGRMGDLKPRAIQFTVAGYETEYDVSLPQYPQVVSAVESGEKLSAWYSTKRETLFAKSSWVPLYQLSVGDHSILTYGETITAKNSHHRAFWNIALGSCVISVLLFGASISGVFLLRRSSWGRQRFEI